MAKVTSTGKYHGDTVLIRCGDHSMGYSLFYGVWEFLYEHVVFWL